MKKAFTLVEMLIVVAILATLMTIVFRLGSVGGEDSRRTGTVVKLQKIENCLSGYYAAFGSYPPVKVEGWHNIYHVVDDNGDQEEETNDSLIWRQIDAACRAQPFGCEYPADKGDCAVIEAWSDELKERAGNSQDYPNYAESDYASIFLQGFSGLDNLDGGFSDPKIKNNPNWAVVKLFKFGAMSFLLPRYLFMMSFAYRDDGDSKNNLKYVFDFAQWGDNNDLPCDPFEGAEFDDWDDVGSYLKGNNHKDIVRVANIPSQAACARWMPNLEHMCRTLKDMTFFGVQINNPYQTGLWLNDENPPDPGTHYKPAGDKVYKNAFVTMYDGWGREFYYYSPAPYQSYVVWSAGPNGYTFPPWMDKTKVAGEKVSCNNGEQKTVAECVNDDIMQMSH